MSRKVFKIVSMVLCGIVLAFLILFVLFVLTISNILPASTAGVKQYLKEHYASENFEIKPYWDWGLRSDLYLFNIGKKGNDEVLFSIMVRRGNGSPVIDDDYYTDYYGVKSSKALIQAHADDIFGEGKTDANMKFTYAGDFLDEQIHSELGIHPDLQDLILYMDENEYRYTISVIRNEKPIDVKAEAEKMLALYNEIKAEGFSNLKYIRARYIPIDAEKAVLLPYPYAASGDLCFDDETTIDEIAEQIQVEIIEKIEQTFDWLDRLNYED